MTILLLRHVHAGDRADWRGDDRHRPLSDQGIREADALIATLAPFPIEHVLSSPYARCLASVEPLAAARGLPVVSEDHLAEGTPTDLIRRLLDRYAGTDVVLCSHGDVIEAAVTDLGTRGIDVGPEPAWPKASTWVLDGLASARPTARYLPPPDVEPT